MNKHPFFNSFPSVVRLIAVSAVLMTFLVSCDGGTTVPDSCLESVASVKKEVVSAPETASSSDAKPAPETFPSANMESTVKAETWDGFVYPSEDRSDGKYVMYAERVYYDGSPTPDTERRSCREPEMLTPAAPSTDSATPAIIS